MFKAKTSVPEPAPIYLNLRNQVLTLKPEAVDLMLSGAAPNVWGVLMETGYRQGVVTLVSLSDGTTSLYFGHGGGIIGSGQHVAVKQASQALIARAEQFASRLRPAIEFPLPAQGQVKFYVLTYSGAFTAEAEEAQLGEKRHALSLLFYSAQDVITQVRLHAPQK
jgi:hypothetical protein